MSRPSWAPVDSAEAREFREREAATADDPPQATPAKVAAAETWLARELGEHDLACCDGWLGEDDQGRPVPCLHCRPRLLVEATRCTTCRQPLAECEAACCVSGSRCCDSCEHGAST